MIEGDHRVLDLDAFEDPAAEQAFRDVENRRDLAVIMAAASPVVAGALRLIHVEERPLQTVAALYDLSRFALSRRIEAFCVPWRRAA